MFRSLFRNLTQRLRRSLPSKKVSPPRGVGSSLSVPTVETLEDRCLLSAATTVPAPIGTAPYVGLQDAIMASHPKVDSNIVFLGDSITLGYAYGPGAPIWSAIMARLGAADYGVVGQTTQSLLFQLALGQLIGVHDSAIVLNIGTNNLLEGDSPEATAAGILADVNAIHLFQPGAQLLVLGVPPGAPDPNDEYRSEVNQTDVLVRQELAGDLRASFFDLAPAFEQADGTISNRILSDYIHPTTLGYANMTLALLAPLSETLLASPTHISPSANSANSASTPGWFQRH